jgi:hypothetical protein
VRSKLKIFRYATFVIFAVVGAIFISSKILLAVMHGWHDEKMVEIKTLNAPGGKYSAVVAESEEGGAFASSCSQSIFIIKNNRRESTSNLKGGTEIYSSNVCDTFSDHTISPEIAWQGENKLLVRFSINHTAGSLKNYRLRKMDETGLISVQFFVAQ